MKKYKNILRTLRLPFIFILLCLSIIGVSASRAGKQKQDDIEKPKETIDINNLKIINMTSAFKVIEIKENSDGLFDITYKNEYRKSITGFEVSISGMRIQTELTLGGDEQQFIPSGSTYDKTYSVQENLGQNGIQILAVVFDDGTADGDPKYIKEITDYRLGIKLERERVLPMLENILTSKPQTFSKALEELETHMTSVLPSYQQNGKLNNIDLGIRNERRRILSEIKMLRDKHPNALSTEQEINQFRGDLVFVKQMYERIIQLTSKSSAPQ